MACTPADRLMQSLRVRVPGATDGVIELELFNVVDEFLRRTSAWKYDQEIALIEGNLEYPLVVPIDTTVVRLLAVTHNDVPVTSAASAAASVTTAFARLAPEEIFPDGDSSYLPAASDLGEQGAGLFTYAVYRPDYITVTGTSDEDTRKYPLKIRTALSIARECLECNCGDWPIEDWMFDMYFDVWFDGALGKLMGMKAKPWSDTTLAGFHHRRFRNAMAYRKQEVRRGFAYDIATWRFPGAWTR
jgi:hypothetical protein